MTQVISQRETLPCVMVPTEYKKTGNCETGDCETGNWETGDCETGTVKLGTVKLWTRKLETGKLGTVKMWLETGDCETGDWETGDWENWTGKLLRLLLSSNSFGLSVCLPRPPKADWRHYCCVGLFILSVDSAQPISDRLSPDTADKRSIVRLA